MSTIDELAPWVGWGRVGLIEGEKMIWVGEPPEDSELKSQIESYHGEQGAYAQRVIEPTANDSSWINKQIGGGGWRSEIPPQLSPLHFRVTNGKLVAEVSAAGAERLRILKYEI